LGQLTIGCHLVSSLNREFRERFDLWRLALHAVELAFIQPITGEPLRVHAPLPADLAVPLEKMGLSSDLV
jgi:tRNA pseudouridine65 synthase